MTERQNLEVWIKEDISDKYSIGTIVGNSKQPTKSEPMLFEAFCHNVYDESVSENTEIDGKMVPIYKVLNTSNREYVIPSDIDPENIESMKKGIIPGYQS